MVNAAIRDEDGTAVGLIGFFECVEDPVVATVLLDAARDWLREEHGLQRIWGPMNFDIWHSYRFMTRGFDQVPFYGEPDNKACYPTSSSTLPSPYPASVEVAAGPARGDDRGEQAAA
jgi:hypothetical protein